MQKNYQISFYVPMDYCETVKEKMFKAGAGAIGNYEDCSWQVLGEGQFRPMEGSNPFLGEQNKLEKVQEYKVEMLCVEERLIGAIKAMKEAHPYEEVAYCVVEMVGGLEEVDRFILTRKS